MPDQLQSILDGTNLPRETKAQLWDHFQTSSDENDLQQRMDTLAVPRELKAQLWDMKSQSHGSSSSTVQPGIIKNGKTYPLGTDTADIPEPPKVSPLTKATHIGPGPSPAQEMGQNIIDYVGNPKIMLPTLATAVAAPFTAGMSIPAASATMAAANAGATGIARGAQEVFSPDIPQPPLGKELTWSAAAGAAPELLGGMVRGPRMFTKTPMGEQAQQLLGEKAGLAQVAEHPVIDFMRNVTSGMGGSKIMKRAQAGRSEEEIQSLLNAAEDLAPASGKRLLPSPPEAGFEARKAIIKNIGEDYSRNVAPRYADFSPGEKYGKMIAIDPLDPSTGSTINDLMARRTQIGRNLSDLSADPARRVEARTAAQQYEAYTAAINNALPPDGQRAWKLASNAQRQHSARFENQTVEQMMQSPTKPEDVLEMAYNPNKLKTWNITVNTGGRPTQVSLSNTQLLGKYKAALGQEEWEHVRTAAVEQIVQQAIDQSGNLQADKLKALFDHMEEGPRKFLFGGKEDTFENLVNTISYAERKPTSAAGTLFINIRQGAAVMGLLGGAAGIASGQFPESGKAMMTGGALLLTPNMFARILTSPTARDWLVKSASAATPELKDKMINMAIKSVAQMGGRSAFKAAEDRSNAGRSPIPAPPQVTP